MSQINQMILASYLLMMLQSTNEKCLNQTAIKEAPELKRSYPFIYC
jgi:hypothetical protein